MRITVVPHNPSGIRNFRINKFLLIVLVVVVLVPIITRFFLPRGFLNSSKIEETNKYLENALNVCNQQYKELSGYYKSILSKVESVKRFETVEDCSTGSGTKGDIDSLLVDLRDSRRVLGRVEDRLRLDDGLSGCVPCILPADGYIIQTFGKSKYIFTGEERFSSGIDLASPEGSAVYSTGGGKVEYAGSNPNAGLMVRIDHGYGFKTLYSHLALLKVGRGQVVKRGQIIGYVGKTGKAVGPRLHYEVWVDERVENPVDYIAEEVRYF